MYLGLQTLVTLRSSSGVNFMQHLRQTAILCVPQMVRQNLPIPVRQPDSMLSPLIDRELGSDGIP